MKMITARERISSFTNKLSIWISRIGWGNYANFPQLDEVSNGKISLPIFSVVQLLLTYGPFYKNATTHGPLAIKWC